MFSTTNRTLRIGPRCFARSRRKTSLPPPGLECVTSVTRSTGYGGLASVCARAAVTVAQRTTRLKRAIVMRRLFIAASFDATSRHDRREEVGCENHQQHGALEHRGAAGSERNRCDEQRQ